MLVMKEETFGPVIPVMGFDSIEDALHLMNDTKYGLSGSVFGSVDIAENVAKQMQAGAISINDAGLTAMLRDGEKQSFKKSGIGETRMGRSSMLRFLRKKHSTLITMRTLTLGGLIKILGANEHE